MLTRRRIAHVTVLSTMAAVLALTPSQADTPGGSRLASRSPFTLAYWNSDMGWGSTGAAPSFWTASPVLATSVNSVKKVTAPSYFGSGVFAMEVRDTSARVATTARSKALNAAPGRYYVSNVAVYSASGTAPRFYLEFMNAKGAVLTRYQSTTTPPVPGKGLWMQARGTAPAGTTSVRAYFYSTLGGRTTTYYRAPDISEAVADQTYASSLGTSEVLFIGNERVASTSMTQRVHAGVKYDANHDGLPDPVYAKLAGRPAGNTDPKWYHTAQLMSGSVIRESSTGPFKMWFTGKDLRGGPWSTRYSTSSGGTDWAWAPVIGTNLNVAGVVRNPNTADPSRKYFMLGTYGTLDNTSNPYAVVYRAYYSADGRSWKPLSSAPILPGRDVAYVSYDPVTKRFVASTKQAGGTSDRRFFLSYSTNFLNWTTPRLAIKADGSDPAGSDVYGAPVFRYGEQMVSTPMIWTKGVVKGVNGPITPGLASSTDSVHFGRPTDRSPIIPLGPLNRNDKVNSDDGFITMPSGPVMDAAGNVALVDNKIRVYYGGWNAGHEDRSRWPALFMAEWRKDGFTSMRADGTATLTTKPLSPQGSSLVVNSKLDSGGRLSVEAVNPATGVPYPGFENSASTVVTGDRTAATVTWGGKSLASLAGRPIALNFAMTHGDLYSFRIR